MNTSQTKLLAWGAAGILAVLLSGYVFLFFRDVEALQGPVDADQVREAIDNVEVIEEEAKKKVPYDQIKRAFIELDWTGKPVVEASAGEALTAEQTQPIYRPVEELLRVVMIAGDGTNPADSFCVVKYDDSSGVMLQDLFHGVRFVGWSLHAPLDYIKVERIGPEGVTFSFTDGTREHETLTTEEFSKFPDIVSLDPDQEAAVPADWGNITIVRKKGEVPKKTYEYKPDSFRIGTEDAEYIAENYSEILARDVRTVKHKDPQTGRYDGVEVRSVAEGSVAASHGAQAGDVIKSINGHPVSSVAQAIQFVKTNSSQYDTWEVLVENKGFERTITYKSPQQ